MVQLSRIGKDKVINHHHEVPYKVLDKSYTFGEENSGNKIIHGDNLEALKSLLPQYEGKIDCIYIDPPYNTGNEGRVYNDNVNDPKIRKRLHEVVGKEGEDLSRHDKWLCMMYPRLKLLQKLLSESGAIFISIDDNEQANLKLLCDEIFGSDNFINCFIRKRNSSGKTEVDKFTVNSEYILLYKRNRNTVLNPIYKPLADSSKKLYNKDDGDGRGLYQTVSLQKPASPGPETTYDYIDNNGKTWPCPPKGWRMIYSKVKALENDNRLVLTGTTLRVKDYRNERASEGKRVDTLWTDLPENTEATKMISKIFGDTSIFNNPKPLELVQRCIEIAEKDSIILDSFAGSGTTAHAVMNLNRKDGGNRKFILVELGDYAENITAERVKRVINGYGEGDKKVEGTGGGFDFYELGEPLFKDRETLNEKVGEETLRNYIRYSETKEEIQPRDPSNKYFLGTNFDTDYYFYYEKEKITELNYDFLAKIKREKNHGLIIYADICSLSEDFLKKHTIIFKKIPRDISQF